jgi:hypothetical protein
MQFRYVVNFRGSFKNVKAERLELIILTRAWVSVTKLSIVKFLIDMLPGLLSEFVQYGKINIITL